MIDMASKKINSVKKAAVEKKAAPTKNIENNQSKRRKSRGSETPGKRVNNGGARKGSGRKLGAATKRTRKIADDLAKDETRITPLDYLMEVLNTTPESIKAKLKKGEISQEEAIVMLTDLKQSRYKAAVDSAPYLHPRLSSISASVTTPEHEMFVKECEALALVLQAEEAAKK